MTHQQRPIVARDARGPDALEPLFLVYQMLVGINQWGVEDPLGDDLAEVGRASRFPWGLAHGSPGPGLEWAQGKESPESAKGLESGASRDGAAGFHGLRKGWSESKAMARPFRSSAERSIRRGASIH
jgi:hypothetical protein